MKLDNLVTYKILGNSFGEEIKTLLMYNPKEPFSIKVMFRMDNVWEIGREVLMECLTNGSAGFLNVVLDSDGDVVRMHLGSENGSIVIGFPHSELTSFIHMTYDAVPLGMESDAIDIDSTVLEILSKTELD